MKKLTKTNINELNKTSGGNSLRTSEKTKLYKIVCLNCNHPIIDDISNQISAEDLCQYFNDKPLICSECKTYTGYIVE